LGLVVHSAADGVALGAAAATSKTDVEMIVFIAIMLHKAPASFGLVSFLIHEGLDRSRIRKHLSFFAMAAPIFTIITFLLLKSVT
jgi:zinc transporter 9